jgi:hypothetical protein
LEVTEQSDMVCAAKTGPGNILYTWTPPSIPDGPRSRGPGEARALRQRP